MPQKLVRTYSRKGFLLSVAPDGKRIIRETKNIIRALITSLPGYAIHHFDYQRNHVYRVTGPNGKKFFVKEIEQQKTENLIHQLKKYAEMQAHGIRVPKPYFYFKHRASGREFIVTEFIDATPLERFSARARKKWSIARKKATIAEVKKQLNEWVDKGLRTLKIKGVSSLTGSNLLLQIGSDIRVYYIDPVNVRIRPNQSEQEVRRQKMAIERLIDRNNLLFLLKTKEGEKLIRIKFDEIDDFLANTTISNTEKREILRRLRKQGYNKKFK